MLLPVLPSALRQIWVDPPAPPLICESVRFGKFYAYRQCDAFGVECGKIAMLSECEHWPQDAIAPLAAFIRFGGDVIRQYSIYTYPTLAYNTCPPTVKSHLRGVEKARRCGPCPSQLCFCRSYHPWRMMRVETLFGFRLRQACPTVALPSLACTVEEGYLRYATFPRTERWSY